MSLRRLNDGISIGQKYRKFSVLNCPSFLIEENCAAELGTAHPVVVMISLLSNGAV